MLIYLCGPYGLGVRFPPPCGVSASSALMAHKGHHGHKGQEDSNSDLPLWPSWPWCEVPALVWRIGVQRFDGTQRSPRSQRAGRL